MKIELLKHIPKAINKLHKNIIPIYARGSFVLDNNNKRYLDLTSGIGALSTGHCHPYLTEKVREQADNYVHIQQQIFGTHPVQYELNQKLLKTMPTNKLNNIFYVNSGSEAIDNAIKISRCHTKKSNIISMRRGFHGRSLGALSITSSNLSVKKKSHPLVPGTFFCSDFNKKSLNDILEHQSAPEDTAAIILEPVLGESGVHSVPKHFLKYCRYLCDKHNMLLVADEVQCGAGRTGTWWNISQKDVIPDMITFAKGIASGYQLAGVCANDSILNELPVGFLGGTYGGNAISCAAASATIDIINDENILENVNVLGEYISSNVSNFRFVKEVRQYGLMIAIEFDFSYDLPHRVLNVVEKLRDRGVLVLMSGNKNQYIRLLPPLNIKKEEVDIFLEELYNILNSTEEDIFLL